MGLIQLTRTRISKWWPYGDWSGEVMRGYEHEQNKGALDPLPALTVPQLRVNASVSPLHSVRSLQRGIAESLGY
jgi:hypothetical protein